MEHMAKMTQFSSGDDVISSGKISKGDFEELLSNFNELNEHENNGYEKANPGSSAKIQLLQARLNEWFGDGVIDLENEYAYSVDQGASNRNDYLCSNGQPLSQSDFEGTILPASCQ